MSILPDSKGDLWLATHRALCHFDTRQLKASTFTFQRELRRAEFIWNAAYRGLARRDVLRQQRRADGVSPRRRRAQCDSARSRLHGLPRAQPTTAAPGAHERQPGGQGHPGDRAAARRAMFSLEFAALHFAAPDQNQYAYRLDGLDQGWNEIGNRHSVTYSALPPGDYLLAVRASNCDGIPSREDLKLRIRMLPPWHATWWFRACFAAGVLLLFYVLVRVRIACLAPSQRHPRTEGRGAHPRAWPAQPGAAHRPRQRRIRASSGWTSRGGCSRSVHDRGPLVRALQGRPDLVAYVGADARFADVFTVGMEAVREGVMPLALCLDQLPKRLVAAGRHFDCRYLPIEEGRDVARAVVRAGRRDRRPETCRGRGRAA